MRGRLIKMSLDEVLRKLDVKRVPLSDVWSYLPNRNRCIWDGQYEKVGTYTQPTNREASFSLKLLPSNPLSLTPYSVGIYAIYDDRSCIYVGLTDQKIRQRFNAHVSKLTAVRRHDHPRRWRDYAKARLRSKGEKFESVEEFELGFFSFEDFALFLEGETTKDCVDDMEALIFYGLCATNPRDRFLNTESSVGNKESREKWKAFFG